MGRGAAQSQGMSLSWLSGYKYRWVTGCACTHLERKNTWSDHWLPGNCAKLLAMSFAPPWLIFIHECWAKSASALWLLSLAGSLLQCTHFLMNNCVHPCTYTHKHEFSTDFSITCHDFSGSSFKRCVVNIIYACDSMHRSFSSSEDFTSGFPYLLHGSPLGIK